MTIWKYSAIYINLISFFISLIIFTFVSLFFSGYEFFKSQLELKNNFKVENQIQTKTEEILQNQTNTQENNIVQETANQWYLEIPSINLKAEIKEGTTKEVMDDYIGHFEETSKENGTVGLAAHNRGYKNNYFARLKELKEGDVIYYNYKGNLIKYRIFNLEIIKDTDWSKLQKSEENKITLITCVENQPEYRRCVQGIEIK